MKLDLKWIVIVLLGLYCILSTYRCNQRDGQITQLQLEKQTLDSMKNELGQVVLTQEAIVTNNKQAIKDLTDSLFNLTKAQERRIKDVIAYYKGITKTVIKEVKVPYIDTAYKKDWEDSVKRKCSQVIDFYERNYIKVPRTAKDTTHVDYQATLTAKMDGIYIDSLFIPDSQYIRFATIKGGILKKDASGKRHLFTKRSIQVQVIHTNKLITVTGQNSAIYIEPKKARILEKALLIGAGVFLGTKI